MKVESQFWFNCNFRDLITACPKPSYYLAAPTIRTRPKWYLEMLPEILQSLSKALVHHNPSLLTLKSFHCSVKELDVDRVHFTTYSGLAYINFLIEQPRFLVV